MNSIQEAIRELMSKNAYSKEIEKSRLKKKMHKSINESVDSKQQKHKTLADLWDQVYCTLVDVGDNELFAICNNGKKGKYSYDQVFPVPVPDGENNLILKIVYQKRTNTQPEDKFFMEAKRVAEKFELKTSRKETEDTVELLIYIPNDEPVYFDFIPEQYREKIALENNEFFNNLPVSPSYEGILQIEPKSEKIKINKLTDLWDQVYCTLVDVGVEKIYNLCGGKGKYSYDQVVTQNAFSNYGDNVISIIYNPQDYTNGTQDRFFSEAKKVAEKFKLKTSTTKRLGFTYFNLFVPQNEPIYFDLIPEKFRKKLAIDNGEDLDNLPVSPSFVGTLEIDDKGSKKQLFPQSLITEEFDQSLPFSILPESEILSFIDSVPKATKLRGPASLTFKVGFATEVETASKFKENGRDHVNKQTGEVSPTVKIVKCSEISGLYLEKYGDSKKTIAHNKQMDAYRDNPEYEMEPKREVPSWLEYVPEHRGLFRSKSNGELVLVPLLSKNSRTKTKYFISIDGEDFREASKEEIAPYLTPAKQSELLNGREIKTKLGPDGREITSAAKPLNFYLSKIYCIGNKGQSIF